MRGRDDSAQNFLINVVTVNLNVLRMLMKSGISSDEDTNLIIIMYVH